jgi:hypothetical protein
MPFDRRYGLREDPIVKAIVANDLEIPAHGSHLARMHELVTADGLDLNASPEAFALYRRRVETGDYRLIVFDGRAYHSRLEGGFKRVSADAFRRDFADALAEHEEVYGVYLFSHRNDEQRLNPFREIVDVAAELIDGRVRLMFEAGDPLDVDPAQPLYALVEDRRPTRPST